MKISLRPETEQLIEDRMQAYGFNSADEVVVAALDLLGQEEHERRSDLDELRRQIGIGVEQLKRGEGIDGESAFERLTAGLRVNTSKP